MDAPTALGPLKRANGKSLGNDRGAVDGVEKLRQRALEAIAQGHRLSLLGPRLPERQQTAPNGQKPTGSAPPRRT